MRTVQSNSPGGANVTRIKHTPVDIWTVLPSTGSGPVLSCFEYIDRWTCPSMSWTSLKLPLPVYDLDSKLIQGSFGSPLSTPEMASRSVQPFLHRYRQSPPMLYNGSLLFLLKIAPSHGRSGLHLVPTFLGPSKSKYQTHDRDIPRDHTSPSVTTGHIYVVPRRSLIIRTSMCGYSVSMPHLSK